MPDDENEGPADAGKPAPRAATPAMATSDGHAVVVVEPAQPGALALPKVSRRGLVITSFWAGIGAMIAGIAATTINSLWPRGITGFGTTVTAPFGVNDIQPGEKRRVQEARAWVVRLDDEQAARNGAEPGSLLALYTKCPHLGCTVPYLDSFSFEDPRSAERVTGWFRCPCHGSTYSDAGVRVFGPAPRSMDTFEMTIENGVIRINTGSITDGDVNNGQRAVPPSA
jgi:cytochrome b6-f complex iron-sulfur subunit